MMIASIMQRKNITTHDPSMREIFSFQMRPPLDYALEAYIECNTSDVEKVIPTLTNDDDICDPAVQTKRFTTYDPAMGDILITLISHANCGDAPHIRPLLGDANNDSKISPLRVPNLQIGKSLSSLLLLDGEEFVSAAYAEILGRVPDPIGNYYYGQRLINGVARIQILAELATSAGTENAKRWNKQLWWPYLLLKAWRMPVIGWFSELVCLFTRHHLRELLLRNDSRFIICAFQSVLGRLPDPEGFDHYLAALQSGREKMNILTDLRLSSEGRAAGNRVAGLTAASWLLMLRKAPAIKWSIDLLSLPSVAIDCLRRIRAIQTSLQRQEVQRQAAFANVKESLEETQAAALALTQQLVKYTNETATVMREESAAVSQELKKVANDLQMVLNRTQTDLAFKVKDAAVQLGTSLPQTVAQANTAILAQLAKGETAQQQLHLQLATYADRTRILAGQERVALSRELSKVASDMHIALNKTQADLALKVKDAAVQLGTSLPQNFAQANTAILAQLAKGATAQQQLHQHLATLAERNQTLVGQERAAVSRELSKVASDMQLALNKTQADLALKVKDAAVELGTSLPQTFAQANTAILAQLAKGATAQQQLHQHLATLAERNQALVGQERAAVSRELSKIASDMQRALNETQADLALKVKDAAVQLGNSLPQTFAQANTAILAQLEKRETAQQQFREVLSQLNPQLGRIESYGIAAARRVAVPCGSGAVMLRTNVGYALCSDEDHALIAALVEAGELEPGTRHLIQRILSPGDVFIDVGANIGIHTLAAAQAMQGKGRVIAFEPYPPTARLFAKTIWINGFAPIVEIHSVAASNVQGERALYLGETSGHHSLFPLDGPSLGDSLSVKVKVKTVDQITVDVPNATLIKIDAEGAELEVLAGAVALLNRSKHVGIIAEFGNSHLKRIGCDTREWLSNFTKIGFYYQSIHPDTGVLADISVDELDKVSSINLFFARIESPIWKKARNGE